MHIQEKPLIAAAILAGGKASRLGGIIKGNIEIRPKVTLIEHLLTELKLANITTTIISANTEAPYLRYNLEIVRDKLQNIGPIAGVLGALNFLQDKINWLLILPADLPYISHNEILRLKNRVFQSDADKLIYYAKTASRNHPLCAIISLKALPLITYAVKQGMKRILDIWETQAAEPILFDNENTFFNINTKNDYICTQQN
ncbi:MAG: molybdenum cofactor guanylyltransferase [Gammaproteobacteria bacterium]|nr:molybdenum cofactor guanylyltransferase [Gammaproteobacteria bacterium]